MATVIDAARRRRARHERIRPCPGCDLLSALPLGPLCALCIMAAEDERTLFELVGA
jgi:hypothetical protein